MHGIMAGYDEDPQACKHERPNVQVITVDLETCELELKVICHSCGSTWVPLQDPIDLQPAPNMDPAYQPNVDPDHSLSVVNDVGFLKEE